MPTTKKGEEKQYQVVLDEGSEVQLTLLAWAKSRRLPPGKAIGNIIADWSDAMNGKRNPFAPTFVAGGPTAFAQQQAMSPEASGPMSEEDLKRDKAQQDAINQFL